MSIPKLLTKKQLDKALVELPDWSTNTKQTVLSRTFSFDEHIDGLVFIARVTVLAEVAQHHPDIEFSYCKVKVKLTTHSASGLTQKDFELAAAITKRRG